MGIISGAIAVIKGAASAFTPKPEKPTPDPVQIQIVTEKQKTHREQVQEWINGGRTPEKISKISNNIEAMKYAYALEEESPEAARGSERIREREREQDNHAPGQQPARATPMNFDLGFGGIGNGRGSMQKQSERPPGKQQTRKRSSRKERRSQKNNWNLNVGRWKL